MDRSLTRAFGAAVIVLSLALLYAALFEARGPERVDATVCPPAVPTLPPIDALGDGPADPAQGVVLARVQVVPEGCLPEER